MAMVTKKNARRVAKAVRAVEAPAEPTPPLLDRVMAAVSPRVAAAHLGSLSAARIRTLSKATTIEVSELHALVTAHKLAGTTGLPADALFALARSGVVDRASLVSKNARALRKTVEAAITRNIVGPQVLLQFDAAGPVLSRLKASTAPLKTVIDAHKLKVPPSIVTRLRRAGMTTLADVRKLGSTTALAKKLKMDADSPGLNRLVAHARLSFLASDVSTNALLIGQGYTDIHSVARAPEGVLLESLAPVAGGWEAARIQRTAKAQAAVIDNVRADVLIHEANGFRNDPNWKHLATGVAEDPPKCGCDDCQAAVGPLAYLADLIGYATSRLGVPKVGVAPLYRLFNQTSGDHFYTRSAVERDNAVTASGYRYEEIAANIFDTQVAQSIPFYRLYNGANGDHFYTTDPAEQAQAINAFGYAAEGIAGYVYPSARAHAVPLFRLLKDASHDHFYTIDPLERDRAIAAGYHKEGVENACFLPKEACDALAPHQLTERFHQLFSELPLSCSQVNERVRQVRIVIEVLRRNVAAKKLVMPASFRDKEAQYRAHAYDALLQGIGTSFAELRAARGASTAGRRALAARLAIAPGTPARDYLSELTIDPETAPELDLERLFGLADTNRDPLAHGAKLRDDQNQLTRWNFTGVSAGLNTDPDGILYVSVAKSAGKISVKVYRDAGRTAATLEASGETDVLTTIVPLSPASDANGRSNGLGGEVEVLFKANDSTLAIQVVPQLAAWRLQEIAADWQLRDSVADSFSATATPDTRWPVIDPDLIGPDDLRDLTSKAFSKVWEPRRDWIDQTIEDLRDTVFPGGAIAPAPDSIELLFGAMRQTSYGAVTAPLWPGNAADRLRSLQRDLSTTNDPALLTPARNTLWTTFRLTPEMLARLMALTAVYDDWVYDPALNRPLTANEWDDIFNLLCQVQKRAWFQTWIAEETTQNLRFGPEDFWISLREPVEGAWPPPVLDAGQPRIDPETVKRDELPDETSGQEAIDLWQARRQVLDDFNAALAARNRDVAGATRRITDSLGVAIGVLESNYRLLLSSTPADVAAGRSYVEQTLEWAVEPFMIVMGIRGRLLANQAPPPQKPSDTEWIEMERLLTTAYKEASLWPAWALEEKTAKLVYWEMLKARLPRWRADADARASWQLGLRSRSAWPLIDPDLLREGHFRVRRDNPARDIWTTRRTELGKPSGIVASFRSGAETRAGLETRLEAALGPFPAGALARLIDTAGRNTIVQARLDQIGVSREAMSFVARMHGLLAQTPVQRVTNTEWNEIASILAQAWKARRAAEWRAEEEQAGLALSPGWFSIPASVSTTQFPPPKPPDPPKWRGARADVVAWEDRLQSRINQQDAVLEALASVVSEAEEHSLPLLRDALVMLSGIPGSTLADKATWITNNLLIDAAQSGCQITTRVAQAIETLQLLLWATRTGLLSGTAGALTLLPIIARDDVASAVFDEEWKWMGSYATWRAAMFVFLYPENILLPSLRRHQTPGFQNLLADFRAITTCTPALAIEKAVAFAAYFEDVCTLDLVACVRTTARAYGDGDERTVFADLQDVEFLFGVSRKTHRLYWSVHNYSLSQRDYAQTYWRRLDVVQDEVVSVLGAVPYQTLGQRRFVYLFLKTQKNFDDKLEYVRISLEDAAIEKPIEIALDSSITKFDAALKQTTEQEAPTIRLRAKLPNSVEKTFVIPLDDKGEYDDSRNKVLGDPDAWSIANLVHGNLVIVTSGSQAGTQTITDWFGPRKYGASIAVLSANNARHFVLFHVGVEVVGGARSGYVRIAQNVGATGIAQSWSNVMPVDNTNNADISGGGVALAELITAGKQDLLILTVDRTSGACYFRLWTDLKSNGTIGLSVYRGYADLTLGPDVVAADIDIATHNGELYLYLYYVIRTVQGDQGYYRRHKILNGGFLDGATPWTPPMPCPPYNKTTSGAGIAVRDIDSDNTAEVVVCYADAGLGKVKGRYFVGSSLQLDGSVKVWSDERTVGGGSGNLGDKVAGVGIAIANINQTNVPDLIAFYVDGNSERIANYMIGFDFGAPTFQSVSACVHSNYRPAFTGPFVLSSETPLDDQQRWADRAVQGNVNQPASNLAYVEEQFFFAPIQIALQLQSSGEYLAALDWFRLTLDYTRADAQQRLRGLAAAAVDAGYRRDRDVVGDEYDWLLDPLNPHAIARSRSKTYLRFTLLSIVDCLLDYADAEFGKDTSESVPLARELYMTAFRLLCGADLKPIGETCEGVLGELAITFGERWADYIPQLIPLDLNGFDPGVVRRLVDGLKSTFDRYAETPHFMDKARALIQKLTPAPMPLPRVGGAVDRVAAESRAFEDLAVTDFRVAGRLDAVGLLDPSDPPKGFDRRPPDFGRELPDSRPPFGGMIPGGRGSTEPPSNYSGWLKVSRAFCIPQNPLLRRLRLRASLNLYKIQTCRNISGLRRELDLYAAPTDAVNGMPAIGAGGQLLIQSAAPIRPTPYRYQVLVDRARQLVQLAMQIEQSFLSTLEKRDAEAYALLKARQDINLAESGVRLQELKVVQAQSGVRLTMVQRDRAAFQARHFEALLRQGFSTYEQIIMVAYQAMAVASAVSYQYAGAIQAEIQGLQMFESRDRREQDWGLQLGLAEADYAIANQQMDIAEDQVRVSEQERTIAEMQSEHAREVVDFLARKFTNKDLYDWMSGVLARVYAFFLQQSTATAQLAQSQLAFERQETPPNYIQPDYWSAPSGPHGTTDATAPADRRGLTGSARLLQDITQLDQYAFETNKRKLQLTKMIPLAQLVPLEFQQFRETGVLSFATPMDLFDRDFPGHYLRLIKRVRVSVVALIPPTQGIRATLSSTGLSRVVTGGDVFQIVPLRRDPETLALSSPTNATGLFELDAQGVDMLLPMEGTGVDARWEFRLPKAANQFDFSTIADVVLTLEYTALNSFDYYQDVIQSPALTRAVSADRPFSFRQEFADAWYDLHNPDQSDDPMSVTLETKRDAFPPNADGLAIQHVALYIAPGGENRIELADVELRFADEAGVAGGWARSIDGLISTRKGNAGAWNAMIGKSPVGLWTLRLPKTQSVRDLFTDPAPQSGERPIDRIADLLLVITFSGRAPVWPS